MVKNEENKFLTKLLEKLNPAQQQAVLHAEGPELVLAGAGSGKTRVLVHRIAYLIEAVGIAPANIIAMTFTNKAAGEMRERVRDLLPGSADGMWVGTFHSLFARMLRWDCERLGFEPNFVIYDTKDQENLIKLIMKNLQIDTQQFVPRVIAANISRAKNDLIGPEEYQEKYRDFFEIQVAAVYKEYQKALKSNNAMDFDDLLVRPIELFQKYPLILQKYQHRFKFILVDEYQDTNHAQYFLLKQLAAKYRNICVVGDDDQSIYSWRGADINNILSFEHDYPDAVVIRLEQNYRSTKNILNAAHSVVVKNRKRHEKKLWTRAGDGERVTILEVMDEEHEAESIVRFIEEEFQRGKRNFKDFSILYRTNAQSRALEDGLRRNGIAYVIVGGLKFYERKEIKDVLAYLRLVVNPADSVSLRRIINYPQRNIGEATLAKLAAFAREKSITLFDSLARVNEVPKITERSKSMVNQFYQLIAKYRNLSSKISAKEIATTLVEEIGILHIFKQEATPESIGRMENIRELLGAIAQFCGVHPDATLVEYLEEVALITDIDSWDDRANAVSLMTLHSAKGLEFPVVFITGLEEGLFPLSRAENDRLDVEEERRLFYVGATRAKEKLYTCYARNRRRFGESISGVASRFLLEMDPQYVVVESLCDSYTTYASKFSTKFHRSEKESYQKKETSREVSKPGQELFVGCLVQHPKFGQGQVISIGTSQENTRVTVNFNNHGIKKLVVEYANLRIL